MKSKEPDCISNNIKKYRLLNNMTQEALAEQLGLDTQYYAQLERGERNFTLKSSSVSVPFFRSVLKTSWRSRERKSRIIPESAMRSQPGWRICLPRSCAWWKNLSLRSFPIPNEMILP